MFSAREYTVEADAVSLCGVTIKGADPASFRHVHGSWSRDRKSVYWRVRRIPKADPESFEPLNEIWCRDRATVYTCTGRPVPGARAAAFRALDAGLNPKEGRASATPEGYGADAKSVWFHNATYPSAWGVKGADPATFVVVAFNYARDARAVYYEQRRVAGAIPRSFRVVGAAGYAADEASVFFEGKKLPGADPATFKLLEADFARDRHRYYSLFGRPSTQDEYVKALSEMAAELKRHAKEVRAGAFETDFAGEGHPYSR